MRHKPFSNAHKNEDVGNDEDDTITADFAARSTGSSDFKPFIRLEIIPNMTTAAPQAAVETEVKKAPGAKAGPGELPWLPGARF